MVKLTKADVPARRRSGYSLVPISDTVTVEETGKEIDISSTTNPVARLGLMGTDNSVRFVKGGGIRGVVTLPQTGRSGIEYEGGPLPKGDTLQKLHSEQLPESRPIEVGEVTLVSSGADNPETPAHEFMHIGFQELRHRFTEEEFAGRYGEDFAQALYNEDFEHPLIQAIMQTKGRPAYNDYMVSLTPEDQQLVFRSIKPIFELALEVLDSEGIEPRSVAKEPPEQEAKRKLQRTEFTPKVAKGFLANLKSMLFGGN